MSLDFRTISTEDYDMLFPFIDRFGEHSCTWSFTQMFKYSDSYCLKNGCVYLMRDHLNSAGNRVYMLPLCPEDLLPAAIEEVITDAQEHDCNLEFNNVTNAKAQVLETSFPGRFHIQKDRNWAEYIYSSESLSTFSGRFYSGIRNSIHQFNSKYGKDCQIVRFSASDTNNAVVEDILAYQSKWLAEREDSEDYDLLVRESHQITKMLQNFRKLHISGIVIYHKGEVIGYNFGAPNSRKCFDIFAEKGDIRFRGVYQKLVNEIALLVCDDYELINREEDIGIEGLRASKLRYGPRYLLEKSIAKLQ